MKPIIDHVHITVSDLDRAEKFYDRLMPLLGFETGRKIKAEITEHDFTVVEYFSEFLHFAIVSPREQFADIKVNRRRPGSLHHLAFRADSPDEVDRLFQEISSIGAEIVTPPKYYPEYGPTYYALFFKDTENIKYEIVFK
ncbi:MAG: VOC family protein [Bacillota bacterium]|nr:VOC family protein [Bacillota bacterium]